MTAGERIRSERRRLKLTQKELAAIGGVSRNMQSLYELGQSSPSLDYLVKIRERGCDTEFIVGGLSFEDKTNAEFFKEIDGLVRTVELWCKELNIPVKPFHRSRLIELLADEINSRKI